MALLTRSPLYYDSTAAVEDNTGTSPLYIYLNTRAIVARVFSYVLFVPHGVVVLVRF
jgi:hypothetical protein